MSDGPIKQSQCDKYRDELYGDLRRFDTSLNTRINKLENKMAAIEAERRFVRYLTPILVGVIITIGGVAFNSIIKNTVRDAVKKELGTEKVIPNKTSMLSRWP